MHPVFLTHVSVAHLLIAWLSLVRRFVAQKLSRLRVRKEGKGGRARVLSYHVNLGRQAEQSSGKIQTSHRIRKSTLLP